MPVSASDIQKLGKYALDLHLKNNPVDQIGQDRPLLKFLMGNKKPTASGSEFIVETLRKDYGSNFQWYYGGATVTYNTRDSLDKAKFSYGSAHDGFTAHEDDFTRAGIVVNDDNKEPVTADEKTKLHDMFKEFTTVLKEGFEEALDYQVHLDGSQDADAIAGLDHLVSTNGLGTVGSIDASTSAYWQNNFQTAITGANLVESMELQKQAIEKNRGRISAIFAGEEMYNEYRKQADAKISRQVHLSTSGQSTGMDVGVTDLFFHGKPVYLNHTQTDVQTATSAAVDWTKRMYFLDDRHMAYKPIRGHDMKSRNPERNHDNYNWYWALTHKFAITTNKRRAHSVLALA